MMTLQTRLSALSILLLGVSICAHTQEIKGTRPALTGISHVVVLNDDLSASTRFYHGLLNWPETKPLENGNAFHYQVGPDQYVEVKQPAKGANPVDRIDHVAFKTADAEAMRAYLALNGVAVPAKVERRADGGTSFMVTDPEGYAVEFVQGGTLPPYSKDAVSTTLMHVGIAVRNEPAEHHFFIDVLGFRPYWAGWNKDEGHIDGVFDYKSLQVPEGTDWIEFMLLQGRLAPAGAPWPHDPHHFAPGVVSVEQAYTLLLKRGMQDISPRSKPQHGRDGKGQLNLYDPNGLRVELMDFAPTARPCCTSFTGPQPTAPAR